jgi:hypothetical protein
MSLKIVAILASLVTVSTSGTVALAEEKPLPLSGQHQTGPELQARSGQEEARASTFYYYRGRRSPGPQGAHKCKPYETRGHYWVLACFRQKGDRIFVRDGDADGYRAGAVFQVRPNGRTGVCDNRHGAGTWSMCNLNLVERRRIRIAGAACSESSDNGGPDQACVNPPDALFWTNRGDWSRWFGV